MSQKRLSFCRPIELNCLFVPCYGQTHCETSRLIYKIIIRWKSICSFVLSAMGRGEQLASVWNRGEKASGLLKCFSHEVRCGEAVMCEKVKTNGDDPSQDPGANGNNLDIGEFVLTCRKIRKLTEPILSLCDTLLYVTRWVRWMPPRLSALPSCQRCSSITCWTVFQMEVSGNFASLCGSWMWDVSEISR